MTDHENQPRDAGLESPDSKTSGTPDVTRRKIGKAALTTPLVMTLGPASVLGTRAVAAASPGTSVTGSLTGFNADLVDDPLATSTSSEDCIPRTIAAPIAAPAPAPLPPAPRPSRWELWMSRRSGTTLQPSTTFAQPTYTQPSTSTSGGLLDRRNAWLARRRGTTAPTTTVTAPAAAEPVVQTGACGEQLSVPAPAPAPPTPPTRLSRRELWERLRRNR